MSRQYPFDGFYSTVGSIPPQPNLLHREKEWPGSAITEVSIFVA
jgi:hypothetical protein